MTILRESWKRAEAHLRRAHELADRPALDELEDYLGHNELELAANVLADFGDEHGHQSRAFWEALMYAYEDLERGDKAKRCFFRIYEAEHGFIEARLTLLPPEDGGRARSVFTDYRPDWNIGNRTDSGEMEINGAPITLEDAPSIRPGGTGLVRLHPLLREAWMKLEPGTEIAMHEGARVVGKAIVLRVMLRRNDRPAGATS
jgi:hypothetical protein